MLRDDGEAQRQRLDALDRDLAEAKREIDEAQRELEELRPRAESADRLEAQNRALCLRLAPARAARRRVGMFVFIAVALVFLSVTAYLAQEIERARRAAALAEQNASHEVDDLRQSHRAELSAAEETARALDERATRAEQRIAELDGTLDVERRASAELRRDRSFVALAIESARVRAHGRDDLGARCHVALSPSEGECRARITCGDAEIYPSPGDGGYFSCDAHDGHLVRGADVNGSSADGDPMLMVDGPGGLIVVSDGPHPAWSVEIRTDPF